MENEQTKDKKSSRIWILAIVAFILLIGVIILLVVLLLNNSGNEPDTSADNDSKGYVYESKVITEDPETLQQMVDELMEKAAEGQMALEFQNQAYSEDGSTFSCYLANSISNSYDMFMVIYIDSMQEEVARTGLIPIGARIEEFTTTTTLGKGEYEATIMFNQVEDDHETIHAQVNVGYTLVVQ